MTLHRNWRIQSIEDI